MYKIIGNDGKTYGPVPIDQIRQWMAQGRVNALTMVQLDGSNDWKPLASFAEFGAPPMMNMPPRSTDKRGNGMAIAGLTMGIIANLCCHLGIIFGILGVIFSAIAIRHEGTNGEQKSGMAWAGLILSIIGLCWHVIIPLVIGTTLAAFWAQMLHPHF